MPHVEELTFEEVQKRFVTKVLEMDGKRQETRWESLHKCVNFKQTSQKYTRSLSVFGAEEKEDDWKVHAGGRIRLIEKCCVSSG